MGEGNVASRMKGRRLQGGAARVRTWAGVVVEGWGGVWGRRETHHGGCVWMYAGSIISVRQQWRSDCERTEVAVRRDTAARYWQHYGRK